MKTWIYIMLFQRNVMLVAALGFVLRFPGAKVHSLLPLRNLVEKAKEALGQKIYFMI